VVRAGVSAIALVLSAVAFVAPARTEALAPGSALHPPESASVSKPERTGAGTTVEAQGLYSYTTPFAPPRWIRVQQNLDVVWGTIDINDSFGMCTRERFDGTLNGNLIAFYVPLEETNCPCNGPDAGLTFSGLVDGAGLIHGTWANACGAEGTWDACIVIETSATEAAGTCFLPDNAAPPEVRQTPAGNRILWAALAALLVTFAFPAAGALGARRNA